MLYHQTSLLIFAMPDLSVVCIRKTIVHIGMGTIYSFRESWDVYFIDKGVLLCVFVFLRSTRLVIFISLHICFGTWSRVAMWPRGLKPAI